MSTIFQKTAKVVLFCGRKIQEYHELDIYGFV